MEKKVKLIIWGIVVSIICSCCGVGFFGYKLYKHEKMQASQISGLMGQVSDLMGQVGYTNEKLSQMSDYYNFETEYKKDTFNYFAIGNSLTLITSWGRGICSTEPDNDYFNLLKKTFENKYLGGGSGLPI